MDILGRIEQVGFAVVAMALTYIVVTQILAPIARGGATWLEKRAAMPPAPVTNLTATPDLIELVRELNGSLRALRERIELDMTERARQSEILQGLALSMQRQESALAGVGAKLTEHHGLLQSALLGGRTLRTVGGGASE